MSANAPALSHSFVAHRTADELCAAVVPFLSDAVARGSAVYVNVASEELEALRAGLGDDAVHVTWSDTYAWVPHPGRRLRAIEDLLAREAAAGRHVSFVGTCPWPSGPAPLVREWERFDAALSGTLHEHPSSMCCVADASILPDDVIDRCRSFHPQLGADPPAAHPGPVTPERFLAASLPASLPIPTGAARLSGRVSPGTARRFLHDLLPDGSLADERADELTVVLSELVTNSTQAGAETITVACWRTEHGFVLQVDDDGSGFDNPLAGYRRPAADSEGGRGVWIARQLADVVEVAPRRRGVSVRVSIYDASAIVPAVAPVRALARAAPDARR